MKNLRRSSNKRTRLFIGIELQKSRENVKHYFLETKNTIYEFKNVKGHHCKITYTKRSYILLHWPISISSKSFQ